MSLFDGLTKQQQAWLMELAHQKFPAKSLHQRPAITIPQEEDDIELCSDQQVDTPWKWLSASDDDGEDSQSCRSDEESEKGDEYDEQIQVWFLQTELILVKRYRLKVRHLKPTLAMLRSINLL